MEGFLLITMKTNVRIQRSKSNGYDVLTMQILHTARLSKDLRPIGHISWQGDDRHGWYAMHFVMQSDLSEHIDLLIMYKLACYIKDRTHTQDPIEIMGIIGGEEHFYTHGRYVSITDNGKQVFGAYTPSGSLYTMIVAANDIMAGRIIDGMIKRKEVPMNTYTLTPLGSRLNLVATRLESPATTAEI